MCECQFVRLTLSKKEVEKNCKANSIVVISEVKL